MGESLDFDMEFGVRVVAPKAVSTRSTSFLFRQPAVGEVRFDLIWV